MGNSKHLNNDVSENKFGMLKDVAWNKGRSNGCEQEKENEKGIRNPLGVVSLF